MVTKHMGRSLSKEIWLAYIGLPDSSCEKFVKLKQIASIRQPFLHVQVANKLGGIKTVCETLHSNTFVLAPRMANLAQMILMNARLQTRQESRLLNTDTIRS
jgi:hypothetical protein